MKQEKRFKPKDLERYYYVNWYFGEGFRVSRKQHSKGFITDRLNIKANNCFPTKAQATKKLREIKAILRG